MEAFEYAAALGTIERFFWSGFTDTYVEMVKARCRNPDDTEGRGSALATLRLAKDVFVRLFAPFLPYVAEEVWSWTISPGARAPGPAPSVHRAPWPTEAEFAHLPRVAGDGAVFLAAVAFLEAVNRAKSARGATVGRHVKHLRAAATARTLSLFERSRDDVLAAARVVGLAFEAKPSLEEMAFEVTDAELADPVPRTETAGA
jgi:valyl-tRNA synthetase